jgi:outer membrane protein
MASAAGAAAREYTLDDCIRMAEQTNPTLVSSRSAISNARAGVLTSAGRFLPSLSLSLSRTTTKNGPETPLYTRQPLYGIRSSDSLLQWLGDTLLNGSSTRTTTTTRFSRSVNLDYTLFDGFQNVWGFLGSRASKRQAENNYIVSHSDQIYFVKLHYFELLKAQKDLEVATEAVKRSEELLKVFKEKFDVGSASKSEVLKQQVQYGNDQLTLVRAQNNLKIAANQLALDIGANPSEDYSIADIPASSRPVDELATFIQKAMDRHPAILAEKAGLDASRYDVRSAWGQYFPNLSLRYSYSWGKETFSDIIKGGPYDHAGTLSLALTYSIFDGFSRERNLKLAKNSLNNSRASYYYLRNQIIKEIQDAHRAITLAQETMKVTAETEKSASEDMDLVQAKYNLGSAALWELLDAQVSLRQAQFNKVAAEFDYYTALAGLQKAMGE